MHRHGYKGRKFGRETDQRGALTTGLIISLFEHRAIKTTLAKAKEIRPAAEKLITFAKQNNLASRRLIMSRLNNNIDVANLLVDKIAPAISRTSGYLRIVREDNYRVGDNAEIATIEFVDKEEIAKALEKQLPENSPQESVSKKPTPDSGKLNTEKEAK